MSKKEKAISVAKVLAPEEILPGSFVALHEVTVELPSFLWCGDAAILPPHEPVRITWLPWCVSPPLKVKAVCLPYVFVTSPKGAAGTLDVRRHRLARLDDDYCARVWKMVKEPAKRPRAASATTETLCDDILKSIRVAWSSAVARQCDEAQATLRAVCGEL